MKPGVLKLKQKEIFKELKKFSDFYLVGGTGLALQMGHRVSEDFDLFRKDFLDKSFFAKLYRVFKPYKLAIKRRHSEQAAIEADLVKVHFVRYNYPLLFKLVDIDGVKTASIKEIALMKAFSIGKRATLKDYVDMYFIVKENMVSLDQIVALCEKKYKGEFNGRLFLEQLTYLKDIREIEEMPIEFLRAKVTREQLVEFFKTKLKQIKL